MDAIQDRIDGMRENNEKMSNQVVDTELAVLDTFMAHMDIKELV